MCGAFGGNRPARGCDAHLPTGHCYRSEYLVSHREANSNSFSIYRAEGDDYESVSVELTFSGDSAMEVLCHSVSPVDDTVVENEEVFTLSLSTSESLVTIPIGSAVLRITDNDGRYRLRSFDIQHFNNLFRYVL